MKKPKIYHWYKFKLEKNPAVVIISSLIALFAVIGSLHGGVNAAISLYNFIESNYFEDRILYKNLERLNTGLNIDFVDSIIGSPIIIKKLAVNSMNYKELQENEWVEELESKKYTERIYKHSKYFLQIITDKENMVAAYAVTIRDKKFNPGIPLKHIFSLQLGRMTLSDLTNYEPIMTNIGNWGMSSFYVEANYFGNPGFYKHYLFGLSDSGCCVDDELSYQLLELGHKYRKGTITSGEINNLRKLLKPNTFGVVDGWRNKNLLDYFMSEGIGVNYYDTREVN